MSVAILTDTNSGIFVEEGNELGISVIPMPVIVNGQDFLEGVDLTHERLYEFMRNNADVTTSQPSPQTLMDKWDELLKSYDEVVHIPMSSGLSASCESAKALAKSYNGKVQVVDNHRISVTLRESVFDAKKLADRGKSAEEIRKILEDHAYDASIYITVNTLSYLKKSGRVTASAAAIATVLDIKPVLTIQGDKLDSFKKVRGMKKSADVMIDALKNELETRFKDVPYGQLNVYTAGTLEKREYIDSWLNKVQTAFPEYNVTYSPLSCSIASHTGVNSMGIGACISLK